MDGMDWIVPFKSRGYTVMSILKTCLNDGMYTMDGRRHNCTIADFMGNNQIYGFSGSFFIGKGTFKKKIGRIIGRAGEAEAL